MTPEEKAKRYDEALRRARKLKENPTSVFYEYSPSEGDTIADYIFPELKESEDERIRKAIHIYFDWLDGRKDYAPKGKYTIRDMIAWLEKQGGQKPQGKSALEAINEEKVDNQFCVKSTDNVEPKFKVKYAGNEYNVLEVKDVSGVTFYGIEDEPNHIDYVKAENCERVDGYNIKENGSLYPTKPAVFSEHKPAWSEEDEKSLDALITSLNNERFYRHLETLKGIDVNVVIDWLKSLKQRYAWKPSEEQIKHLTDVVYDAKHKNRIYTNGYEPYSYLYALLMQLKKLKG
jgi:hypothetical protein